MADGTDDLADLEAEIEADADRDPEAAAAVEEARSVLDDLDAAGESTAPDADADIAGDTDTDVAGDTDTDVAERTATDTDAAERGGSATDADAGSRLSLPSLSVPSLSSLFSPRYFLLAVVAAVVGAFAGGLVPLVGGVVAAGLGVFASAFVLGLVTADRRYLEATTAGGAVVATLVVLGRLEVAVAAGGSVPRLAAFGGGIGVLAALVGTYFGRDLRAGLVGRVDDATAGLGRDDEF